MAVSRSFVLPVILIAVAFLGYWFLIRKGPAREAPGTDSFVQVPSDETITASPDTLVHNGENENVPGAASSTGDDADCITADELNFEGVLADESVRFEALMTTGPALESYRGLPAAQLEGLAVQGDSAAMAALGAISIMRAMNFPEDDDFAFLILEQPSLLAFGSGQALDPVTTQHLEEAREWFYKAALHGRLLALQNAGEVIAIVAGSPSQLGWIQQGEYEALDSFEQQALDPGSIYAALAFEIAPELRTSALGQSMSEATSGSDRKYLILNELVWQFEQDREALGLPPTEIPESNARLTESLETPLCEP
jgi:hypothetical protein